MTTVTTKTCSNWVDTFQLLDHLKFSRTTLMTFQRAGVLRPGLEYRRMGLSSRSPLQWNLPSVEQRIAERTAATEQRLELVGAS
jgi:hypothetical protein